MKSPGDCRPDWAEGARRTAHGVGPDGGESAIVDVDVRRKYPALGGRSALLPACLDQDGSGDLLRDVGIREVFMGVLCWVTSQARAIRFRLSRSLEGTKVKAVSDHTPEDEASEERNAGVCGGEGARVGRGTRRQAMACPARLRARTLNRLRPPTLRTDWSLTVQRRNFIQRQALATIGIRASRRAHHLHNPR